MKNISIKNTLFIALLLFYNILFWTHAPGLNISIFTLILLGVLFYLNPAAKSSKQALITAAGSIFCAFFFVFHHTILSGIILFASFFLAVGFIHVPVAKYIPYSYLNTFYSYLNVPAVWAEGLSNSKSKKKSLAAVWRVVQRGIIPCAIFLLFYFIYWNANPVFGNLASIFSDKIFYLFRDFFSLISMPYFLFLLGGTVLLTGIIFYSLKTHFLKKELDLPEFLKRKTTRLPKTLRHKYYPLHEPNPVALKNENKSAVWLLFLVNALLLIVNCIDVSWIWFGFNVPQDFSLKQFVHEGTYLLIISILISMALLIFYFRGNLNFYRENGLLKTLAYIWIFQNMILTFSVFLRNLHYIQFHGLAYKRIGVIVFLLLTIIGLFTLFLKIRDKKSHFFLIRANTWSLYCILIFLCAFHWDVLIVKYNLQHKNIAGIDTDFYYHLSTGTLPILQENISKVENQMNGQKSLYKPWAFRTDISDFKNVMETRSILFLENWQNQSWQSWNYADHKTAAKLNNIKK